MKIRSFMIAGTVTLMLAGGSVWALKYSPMEHAADQAIANDEGLKFTKADVPKDNTPRTVVVLPTAKRSAAKIHVESVQSRTMSPTVVVPGRVQYDDTRHIEIKAATDCVLLKVLVKPGDVVKAGQVLAVLTSPEVGTARANFIQRQMDLKLAERSAEWERETCDNVLQLVKEIETRKPLKQLRSEFDSRKLGEAGSSLVTAYARWELAQSAVAGLDRTAAVLPERTVRERLNEVEAAQANVKAVCEQSSFESRRRTDTAQFALDDARRRVEIAWQNVAMLLGYREEAANADTKESNTQGILSQVECRAPFAGTIERKVFSASERAKPGETMFVLADTRQLWIAADLREREWSLLNIAPESELIVESPALPNQKFAAKLYYIGREVSQESNAVPLVATIDNSAGLLRPGLFVRITLANGEHKPRLAVPSSAVVEHDQKKFVFIGESEDTFRRVDVTTGLEQGEMVEITHGLQSGMQVVTHGGFILKSELLLESEK
ncbi:MAG: efflux RND transporter periplasmic adaptor subunit [Planctomycetia bacterium]|nr:efflux RND transporter periplasmic adaptor subunit [Planctomycetia bacterium]